jgi:hypothetical protein
MAVANIVFGKVSGGWPAFDHDFTSEAVSSGGVSAAATTAHAYARITPSGGPMWAAFSTGTPNPAAAPRVLIPDGSSFDAHVVAGVKVAVLDA